MIANNTSTKRTEVVDVVVTSMPHMTAGDVYDYVAALTRAGVPRDTLVNHVTSIDTGRFIGLRASVAREIA